MQDKKGHPLRQERLRKGWTQQELADFAQVSLTSIERAERGNPLRVDICSRICRCLGKEKPEELGLQCNGGYEESRVSVETFDEVVDVDKENVSIQYTENNETMNRREAIKKIRDVGTALTLAPDLVLNTPFLQQLPKAAKPSSIDGEILSHFARLNETCWFLSKGAEIEVAEPILWAYLSRITEIAEQSSEHQQIASTIASQGYLLAALLAGHRDDLNARQSLCEQAFLFANVAKDRNLQVASLRQLALTFDYKERPGKALQTYQQSIPYLDEVSPLLRSRMYAGLSGSYASFEQEEEALRFLGLAYESFPEKPEHDPSFLYADCEYFTLLLWDGLTHLDLHQLKEAEKAFAQVDGLHPKIHVPERVRIEFLNYQAETFTKLRKMEQAHDYLEEAVKASLALGSERRYSQAFEVYKQTRIVWRYETRIKGLGNLFTR
jgi:DNA-binding XRE family transcriptional regulator